MADISYVPIDDESVYYKSNKFITSKGKMTVNENRVVDLAICKIQRVSMDINASLITRIYASDLKTILQNKTNIYALLKTVSRTLCTKSIMIENGKGDFVVFPIIQKAEYRKGVFTIRFNEEIRPYITGMDGDFTKLKIAVSEKASSVASARLYQILNKEVYPGSKSYNKKLDCYVTEYSIADLKFIFGIADIDHPALTALKEKMKRDRYYDWDLLYDALPESEKKYESSNDFMKRAIEPARKELDELSNISFDYEGVSTWGKKVTRVRFFIRRNSKNDRRIKETLDKVNKIIEKEDIKVLKSDLEDLYEEFIGQHMLTKENIDGFLEKADYDVVRVRNAIYYTSDRGDIYDFVGYVVSVLMHPEWDLTGGAVVVNGTDVNKELVEVGKTFRREQIKKDTKSKNASQIWETVIKTRDDFDDFLNYMEDKNRWDLDTFELIFDDNEKVEYWKKWALDK